ncbi:MAG: cytochrome c oxidase subunit II [Solirubrobacteraceae bacterium]
MFIRRPVAHSCLALVSLVWALVALLGLATGALADPLTPESQSGSPNAEDIDNLYKLILALALVIFIGVEGALIYALVRFRARKGRVASQIHGNVRLEIAWTVVPVLILVLITTVTFVSLDDIRSPAATGRGGLELASGTVGAIRDQPAPPGGKALKIIVDGQQYVWRYQYPGPREVFAYTEMVVPEDTTLVLEIRSIDVAHSWWIPALGGKFDAIPGYVNKTWFKARPGRYRGQCAEFCGRNHADMLAWVRVVPVAEYEAWYARKAREIEVAQQEAAKGRAELERGSGG